MWPFGKKSDADSIQDIDDPGTPESTGQGEVAEGTGPDSSILDSAGGTAYDPINGGFGPFDGDSVDYRAFDFSDFAKGGLDLGSMLIPVPHAGEVQVEMGQSGPQQIHILTPYGRLTPAAFAAPRSGGQWSRNIDEFREGMEKDGLEVTRRSNDWGEELIGTIGDGVVRVIGVDGPRWMFRLTLAGPTTSAADLAELAYEVMSRTFVNRGDEPAPAGTALPVVIPQAMAEELQKAVERQAQQSQQADAQSQVSPETSATAEAPVRSGSNASADPGTHVPPRRRSGGTVDQQIGEVE